MQKYTTVFFDLFNTLISVAEVPASIGLFTADILGFDREQWNSVCFSAEHEICHPTKHEQVLYTLAKSIDPEISYARVKQATEHRQRRFDYALWHVRDDVLDVLRQLKDNGITLGLVSNASTAEVGAWSDSPLAGLFDKVFFSCECGFKKPDDKIYRYAINEMDSVRRRCLFVGDGGSNELTGAYQAGLMTVLTTQFSTPQRVEKVRQQQGTAISHEIEHICGVLEILN